MEEDIKPTKEQLALLEKQLITFLDDMLKSLLAGRDLAKRLGFAHLGNTLNSSVESIRIYRKEYDEARKERK